MPNWKELKRFCKQTDHYFYRKRDPDGSVRFTKVSKNPGQINGNLWKTILRNLPIVLDLLFRQKVRCVFFLGQGIAVLHI